jgi:hypothetical protein
LNVKIIKYIKIMKRLKFGIVALATCMMFTSCGAKKAAVAEQQPQYPNYAGQYPPQYPPQYQQYPPQQVSQSQSTEDGFTEVAQSEVELAALEEGTGEIRAFAIGESPNQQLALNTARAQGIAALQEKIETYVRYGLNQYMDQTRVNDQLSIDDKTRNDVVVAAKGIVVGAEIHKSRKLYNAQKKMYRYEVCMKYNRAGIMNAMEEQSQRILKNRQQFEKDMQEAWDELDRNHGRIPIREEQTNRKNEQEQQNLDRANQRQVNVMDAQTRHDVGVINAANGKSIYYLVLNGQQQGPFAYEQLQAMVASRQMNIETKVWREGLATWVSAGSLQELSGLFSVMPTGAVPPPVY